MYHLTTGNEDWSDAAQARTLDECERSCLAVQQYVGLILNRAPLATETACMPLAGDRVHIREPVQCFNREGMLQGHQSY